MASRFICVVVYLSDDDADRSYRQIQRGLITVSNPVRPNLVPTPRNGSSAASNDAPPRHIGIIMDGNGRWAVRHGLLRRQGHRRGFSRLPAVIDTAADLGVSWLSFYCWSTENWNRPVAEQCCVLGLIRQFVHTQLPYWQDRGLRFAWSGRRDRVGHQVHDQLVSAERVTANNSGMTVCLCVDYGGHVELAHAVCELARHAAAGRLNPARIDEKHIRTFLYQPDMPDVDLLIRTSGEQRVSNFLTWQSAYAEMSFPSTLWPDFSPSHLHQAIREYVDRDRRYGGLSAAVIPQGTTKDVVVGTRTSGSRDDETSVTA
ncbi:polyprenyl diphosphate synthase [Saccharomonospora sp. NPDC046836]|uniref:polyprenyl diphosphate synthase n=1 Tax=Saccharomonospora sp. NPDC046836 TaxID=3156921 RepID=UPI0033E9F1EC